MSNGLSGRISPAGFPETFKNIYHTVDDTVKGSRKYPESKQEIEKKE
jgi:hypothetical protein